MAIKVANNQSLTAITALPAAITGGAMTLLETQTASSSATITFDSNIDDTYKEYIIRFYDVHPATDTQPLTMNFRDGSTDYDASKTTTSFDAFNQEAGGDQGLRYDGDGADLANGTGFQDLNYDQGNDNDASVNGYLRLYDPSDTTFVTHFQSSVSWQYQNTYAIQAHVAGYCNTASAIDGVQFKFVSGEIQGGTIGLFGVK